MVIKQHGGSSLLGKYGGSLSRAIEQIYGSGSRSDLWNTRSVSKAQWRVFSAVKSIFPNEEIMSNYKLPNVQRNVELDIFLPNLSLAFEYQGEQHYFDSMLYGSVIAQQRRVRFVCYNNFIYCPQDDNKRQLCINQNITLIPIPYWWNQRLASLKATIHQYRPDLIASVQGDEPIVTTPPKKDSKLDLPQFKASLGSPRTDSYTNW